MLNKPLPTEDDLSDGKIEQKLRISYANFMTQEG